MGRGGPAGAHPGNRLHRRRGPRHVDGLQLCLVLAANMNRLAGKGLVAQTFRGRDGGKAWLTPARDAAITQFWGLAGKFREWLKDQEA